MKHSIHKLSLTVFLLGAFVVGQYLDSDTMPSKVALQQTSTFEQESIQP